MSRALPLVLFAATLALAGCEGGANPNPPVPPAKTETVPLPPVSGMPQIWEPGHWDWNGQGYDWVAGQWVARGDHSAMWQPGYWARINGTWTWQVGHWVQ